MSSKIPANSKNALAKYLGYNQSTLSYLLYIIPDEAKYIKWDLPKKGGGFRTIKSPTEKIKILQYRLAEKLTEYYCEYTKFTMAHGFVVGRSIITNAKKHKNKRYVFNIDLKDFFPSINFGRVRGFFMKSKNFSLSAEVSTILSQIICYENELPQGSPTSPIVSNLIGHMLDQRLVSLAKNSKCNYSRYVDDISFSTNQKIFPKSIGYLDKSGEWKAGVDLLHEISRCGFFINDNKTSMQLKFSRQMVTGLVVNKKINVTYEYYKHIRSCCYELFKNGSCYDRVKDNNGQYKETKITLRQIEGRINYVYQIKYQANKYSPNFDYKKSTGIVKLYQKFLIYKYLISNEHPTVIFEGKTDPIYIRYALQQRIDKFPKLISKKENGFEYKVNLMSISGNLKKMFGLNSSCSGLDKLLDIYYDFKKTMPINSSSPPVILVYDNDEGAKKIKGKMHSFHKLNLQTVDAERTYNLFDNISILFSSNKDNGTIEDLFDKKLLSVKIDGKEFSKKNDFNINTHYGKLDFAKKVIGPNKNNIDFSKFDIILNAINNGIKN